MRSREELLEDNRDEYGNLPPGVANMSNSALLKRANTIAFNSIKGSVNGLSASIQNSAKSVVNKISSSNSIADAMQQASDVLSQNIQDKKVNTPSGTGTVDPGTISGNANDYVWSPLSAQYGMDSATAFQEALSNTAHQREVKDLQAAGLNPVLSATGGSGATSFAGTAAVSNTAYGSGTGSASEEPNLIYNIALGAGFKPSQATGIANTVNTLFPNANSAMQKNTAKNIGKVATAFSNAAKIFSK